MKIIVKAVAILGIVLLLLLGIAVTAVKMTVDESWLEQKIITATGQREVKIAAFEYSLLSATVELRDVFIGSPEDLASSGHLLQLEKARLELNMLSLLYGPLVLEHFVVSNLDVRLLEYSAGQKNWGAQESNQTQEAKVKDSAAARGDAGLPDILVKRIDVNNVSLLWQDLDKQESITIKDINLAWNVADTKLPLRASWLFKSEPDMVEAVAMLQSKIGISGNIVSLDELLLQADITSPQLSSGSGQLVFKASPEFDADRGKLRMEKFSLDMPGLKMQGHLDVSDEQLNAGLDLRVEQLSEAIAITGIGPVLDELGISREMSGSLSLQMPQLKTAYRSGDFNLSDFSLRGLGMDLSADVNLQNLYSDTGAGTVIVESHIDDITIFWNIAAAILPAQRDRFRRLAEAYKSPQDKTARVGVEIELDGADIIFNRAEILAMGARVSTEQLLWLSSSNQSEGKLDLTVSRLDKLLLALFGSEAEWGRRFAAIALKADLTADKQQLDVRLDMLDRLAVSRRFEFAAPAQIDTVASTIKIPQMSLLGPGIQMQGALELALADGEGTAVMNIVQSKPRELLDMFTDMRKVDSELLRLLEGKIQLAFSRDSVSINVEDMVLDDTTITGNLANSATSLDFNFELGKLELDRYLPVADEQQAAPPPTAAADDEPLLTEDALAALSELQLMGKISFAELVARGLRLQQLLLELSASEGKLKARMQSDSLYGGSLASSLNLDAKLEPAAIRFDLQASEMQTGPLLADVAGKSFIDGNLNMSIEMATFNGSQQQLLNKLNGNARLDMGEGKIPGIDIVQKLRDITDLTQLFSGESDASENSTEFSSINATVDVNDGIATNKDLTVKAPLLSASGEGQYDITQKKVDYAALLRFANEGVGTLSGLQLPIKVDGTVPDLSYGVDLAQVNPLEVAKFLPGLIGVGAGSSVGGVLGTVKDVLGGSDGDSGENNGAGNIIQAVKGLTGDSQSGDSDGDAESGENGESEQSEDNPLDKVKKLLPF